MDTAGARASSEGVARVRLKREFERSGRKRTTVQALKDAVEKKLRRLLAQNPLRTDFQQHYEAIVAEYNREKDRATIEQTFEALLKLVQELDAEESRALREGRTRNHWRSSIF